MHGIRYTHYTHARTHMPDLEIHLPEVRLPPVAHACAHLHARVREYLYLCVNICIDIYMYLCIYMCVRGVNIYIYICICIDICIYMCVRVFVHCAHSGVQHTSIYIIQ